MNGALSKEIENGSKMSKNTGFSYGMIFLEEDEVDGCWNKWRGPTWDPQDRGRAQGVGSALHPCGPLVHPPGVCSDQKSQQNELEHEFELCGDFFWRKTKCVGAGISGGGHVGPKRQGACPGG